MWGGLLKSITFTLEGIYKTAVQVGSLTRSLEKVSNQCCRSSIYVRLHMRGPNNTIKITSLNLTCLGCFMLPTTAYESNLGSQVARKFVCRWKRAISKICKSFLYFSLRKQASNNLCFTQKILPHFLICKESGCRRTGKLRSLAPEMSRTM